MTPLPPGVTFPNTSVVQYPNGYVLLGQPGVAGAVPYGEGGLARLLKQRRTSTFFSRRNKKPRTLEEMQMLQNGGGDYMESAP